MKISKKGIGLIKKHEGCRLQAYKDSVGVWTIGYGTTNSDIAITRRKIEAGVSITKQEAEEWLVKSINTKYSKKVMAYNNKYHWNQNQFDALCSFAYNIGSIDQLVQNGTRKLEDISEAILLYNKAGGQELEGLTKRRAEEKKLFDKPVKR